MTLAFANGDFQNQGKDQANGPNAPVRTTARSGALMGNPLVLLLDEPSEGLAPIVVATIAKVLRELGGSGATILLAEQNMHFCLRIAEEAVVIDKGKVVHRQDTAGLVGNEHIRRRYLAM
jgi:branched-chain amino acid transport system ATP-binding protein